MSVLFGDIADRGKLAASHSSEHIELLGRGTFDLLYGCIDLVEVEFNAS